MTRVIELTDTNAPGIEAAFRRARDQAGSPVMGMVMTLVVVVDEEFSKDAMKAARSASREHPSRVLGVVIGDGRGRSAVHAEVRTGGGWGGEAALIRLSGEVTRHAASVVLPLLLPDTPVAVWWPRDHPVDPAADPLGQLATRRITDSAYVSRGKVKALEGQCRNYSPGNTDLAWTRLTPWRALLAAALDQYPGRVTGAEVVAERVSPSADLLGAWLTQRLRVDVVRRTSRGPGITRVELMTKDGPIRITRADGRLATFASPDKPDRPVALKRRDLPDLLAEELRHLDEDDIYAGVTAALLKRAAS